MDLESYRDKTRKSVQAHSAELKPVLPKLYELLATGQSAYDALLDVTEAEQEMRDKRMPAVPKPIPDIDEHLALLAIELQWIRRLIEDIESV